MLTMISYEKKSILLLILVLFVNIQFIDVLQTANCYPRSILYSPCRRDIDSKKPISDILHRVTPYVNLWLYLLSTKCHPDLTKLLCSIHAPECRKSFRRERRLPCQRMCRDIEIECLPNVSVYGYKWPQEANCTEFPHSNCIDLSNPNESGYYRKYIKSQREGRSSNQSHHFNIKPTNDNKKIQKEKMINNQIHPAEKETGKLQSINTSNPTYKNNGDTKYNSKKSAGNKSKMMGGNNNNEQKMQNHSSSLILSDQQHLNRKNREFKTRKCGSCYEDIDLETFAKVYCKYPIVLQTKIKQVKLHRTKPTSFLLKRPTTIVKTNMTSKPVIEYLKPRFSCLCPMFVKALDRQKDARRLIRGQWFLMGRYKRDNSSLFRVKVLVKFHRRKLDMKYLVRRLRRNPHRWCKNVAKLVHTTKKKLKDGVLKKREILRRKQRRRRIPKFMWKRRNTHFE